MNVSAATLWIGVGVAVFLPQVILIAQNWTRFVGALPQLGAGLLDVGAMAAVIAVVAGGVAAIAICLKHMRAQGAGV